MCTVTFIPRRAGYCLAMNRDEALSRAPGLSPAQRIVSGRLVLGPSEPGGGSWIALNDIGSCLALVNWYSVAERVEKNVISRGEIVRATSPADSPTRVDGELARLPLDRINPFRLIGIFPATREVVEWCWDLKRLVRKDHRWKARQWISSGFDEPLAQRRRSRTFALARRQKTTGRLDWLRRLHRSHRPGIGPFSTCMHRADAATVSYTEISVSTRKATMCYHCAAPCTRSAASYHSFRLTRRVGMN